MIYAEIKKKIPEVKNREDILTSNVFGMLKLLPDNILIKIINNAVNVRGERLSINENQKVTMDFWKRCEYGEPDIFLKGETFIGIIEAKYYSEKSGSAYIEEETNQVKNEEFDQLAKYWKIIDASMKKEKFIIYLTNDSCIPIKDINTSEQASGHKARIYWLNWTNAHYELIKLKDMQELNITDRKIIDLLEEYFKYKCFTHFMEWSFLAEVPEVVNIYQNGYFEKIDFCNLPYLHIYTGEKNGQRATT